MKKYITRFALKSLGITLFILILVKIDWNKLSKTLVSETKGNLAFFFFSLVLLIPLLYIKVLRWRWILKDLGIRISQNDALKYYMIGLFAGAATPGQLGEFIKTVYLNKKGYPGGASFFSILYDRIYDIIALAFMMFFGLAILSGYEKSELLLYIFASGSMLFLVFFLFSGRFRKFITIDLFKYILPAGIKARLKEFDINKDISRYQMKKSTLAVSFLLTILAYGVVFYRYYLLLITLNLHPPFGIWFGGVTLATFVTLIPISISGIGTRDAVLIGVLGTVGISPEKSVAFSFLILLLMVFNGIVGLCVWMKNPLIPRKKIEI
jgi:uncharacterized protein (TIRG00374 family)